MSDSPKGKRNSVLNMYSTDKTAMNNGMVKWKAHGTDNPPSDITMRRRREQMQNVTLNVEQDKLYHFVKQLQLINVKGLDALLNNNDVKAKLRDKTDYRLIHAAAEKNSLDVARKIVENTFNELHAKESHGRTPLHLAVYNRHTDMVQLLINLGANLDECDNNETTPVQLATELNLPEILRKLLNAGASTAIRGEGGYCPLHTAASVDASKCTELLMAHNASPLVRSNGGSYPIHIAARLGAVNTLNVLLTKGPQMGFPLSLLLNLRDREQQPPLHAAVNGGSCEAVAALLSFGASLLVKQANGTTAIHRAAIQGSQKMLMTLFKNDSPNTMKGLEATDHVKRTPLHWATVFDHVEVVQYLISLGAEVNEVDKYGKTPLLIAASCACWRSLRVILANKQTNTSCVDAHGRHFLHLSVRKGIDISEHLSYLLVVPNIKTCVNEKDLLGMTALHYAAREDKLNNAQGLVALGAEIGLKNSCRKTAFHIAAQCGHLSLCTFFLDSPHGSALKNELDIHGKTPLHFAAEEGHLHVVEMLLQRGVMVTRDHSDNTALHLAVAKGKVFCAKALLSVHDNLIDMINDEGDTALHLAGRYCHDSSVKLLLSAGAAITYNDSGHSFFDDAVTMGKEGICNTILEHPRWEECMRMRSVVHGQLMMGLIKYIPSACLTVLDRCVVHSDDHHSKESYHITYNFRYMHLSESYKEFAKEQKLPYSPLLPLQLMQTNKRGALLSHPLTLAYLRMKWKEYGMFFNFLDLTVYILFLVSLTLVITSGDSLEHYHLERNASWSFDFIGLMPQNMSASNHTCAITFKKRSGFSVQERDVEMFQISDPWFPEEAKEGLSRKLSNPKKFFTMIVILFSFFHFCNGIYRMITTGLSFISISNLVEFVTYNSSLFFVLPFWFGYSTHVQWGAGAISCFLAWFNCLVYFQRFDTIGIYIVMYLEIMKTMWKLGTVFAVLVIAFGLTFHILLPTEDTMAFRSPLLATYRTFILMFEVDYQTTLNGPYQDGASKTMHFVTLTFFFMFVFLLFMPILLINLLIGLAVGDIASVQKEASQKKLSTQIHFYTTLESKLPFLSRWTMDEFKFFPKKTGYSIQEITSRLAGLTNFNMSEIQQLHDREEKEKSSSVEMLLLIKQNQAVLAKIMTNFNIEPPDEILDRGTYYYTEFSKTGPSADSDQEEDVFADLLPKGSQTALSRLSPENRRRSFGRMSFTNLFSR